MHDPRTEEMDYEVIEDAPGNCVIVLNIFLVIHADSRRYRAPEMYDLFAEWMPDHTFVVDMPMYKIEGMTPVEWDMLSIEQWVEFELNKFINKYSDRKFVCLVNLGSPNSIARTLGASLMRWQRTVVFLPK